MQGDTTLAVSGVDSRGAARAPDLPRRLDYGELLLAMVLWGSLYPAGKPVLAAVPAAHVALVRASVALLTLGALVLARGKGREALRQLVRRPWETAILGALSFFLSSYLAMVALQYLPASVVGFLGNTTPLWLSLGVVALRRPRGSRRVILGAAVALAGVALIMLRGEDLPELLSGKTTTLLGVALALLCATVIALQTVWARRVMPGRDPLVMTSLACAWAVPPLVTLASVGGGAAPLLAAPGGAKLLLAYLGVGCTALNFALFNHVLQRVPAARAAVFQYLIPLFSALLAFAFLGEAVTWQLGVGGGAILVGIAITQRTN